MERPTDGTGDEKGFLVRVPFTQYLRPYGEKQGVHIYIDKQYEEKVRDIQLAGFRFELELLRGNTVALYIADDLDNYAIKLIPNGPDVKGAVVDMIISFSISAATIQRNLQEEEDACDTD